jgi:hypothetical protein
MNEADHRPSAPARRVYGIGGNIRDAQDLIRRGQHKGCVVIGDLVALRDLEAPK